MKINTICLILAFAGTVVAEVRKPFVLEQEEMGRNACGPCTVVNSLVNSDDEALLKLLEGDSPLEKAKSFAEKFGTDASVVYGESRAAYTDENGTTDLDLLAMANRLRAEGGRSALTGEFLIKGKDETPAQFMARFKSEIDSSIANGFLPMLSIRSVKATKVDEENFQYQGIAGHWVSVSGITKIDDGSYLLTLLDSLSGKAVGSLCYTAEGRTSLVPMTFEVNKDGRENWRWEKGENCLFIASPDFDLGISRAKWHERTFIGLRYMITAKSSS